MNTLTYDEIEIGKKESFCAVITEEDMRKFREITGDHNPLHCDKEFAKSHGYDGCVVYGLLTSAYLSTLAGMYLPGKYSLIHEVEVKLLSPVQIGQELTISGIVSEKHDLFKRLVLKVTIVGEGGIKLIRGTMKVGVME
jgi:acyl dehydratase